MATGLTYSQNDVPLLHDVSFDVAAGSTTHIISQSTNVSSALLGLLVGLYPPDTGSVRLDGAELGDLPISTSRNSVVLVLQDPWIMSGTIADNIAFGDPGVSRERVEKVATLACLDELATTLPDGLDTTTGEEGIELSTGERRLIALARALLRDPSVLLIEDPMRELTAREETQAIKAINRAGQDRTMIITARNFDASMFSTNQVLHIADGRLTDPDAPALRAEDHRDEAEPLVVEEADTDLAEETAAGSRAHPRLDTAESAWAIGVGQKIAKEYTAAGLLHRWNRTETWLAWDECSAQIVEIKVPRRCPVTNSARAELANEHARAVHLQHPGIARPLRAETDEPLPYAVYERVEGHLLSHLIGTKIDAPEPIDIVAIGADLARTLTYVHRLGHAHLDLGPHVVKQSSKGTIIIDLKHALPVGDEQVRFYDPHRRGAIAPEQLRGEPASKPMDVYALGALLFQAATGRLISTGVRPDISELRDEMPQALTDLIGAMLAIEPEARPTAKQVLNRLRPLLSPKPGDPFFPVPEDGEGS